MERLQDIPVSTFAIPAGLSGLAGVWRVVGQKFALPVAIADGLFILAGVVFVVLVTCYVMKIVGAPRAVASELHDPIFGPFVSLIPISGMLLALGLEPHAKMIGDTLFLVSIGATALLGGWLTGDWIAGPLQVDKFHPGYFLPTVAGGLVGAAGAATIGLPWLGWMSFGIGVVCWLLIGAIVLNRAFFQPELPPSLTPTLAIAVAPPAVAGNAYFALNGGLVDGPACMLAGYTLLMALVQLRLLPLYRRTPFAPSFWAFTFSWASVATLTLTWISILRPAGAQVMAVLVLSAVTTLIGAIAVRSLVALHQGQFLPSRPVRTVIRDDSAQRSLKMPPTLATTLGKHARDS